MKRMKMMMLLFSLLALLLLAPAENRARAEETELSSGGELPTVSTLEANEIGIRSALLRGTILDAGGICEERWFQYRIKNSLDWMECGTGSGQYGSGPFECRVENLEPETRYEFQAMAMNEEGIGEGIVRHFSTLAEASAAAALTAGDFGSSPGLPGSGPQPSGFNPGLEAVVAPPLTEIVIEFGGGIQQGPEFNLIAVRQPNGLAVPTLALIESGAPARLRIRPGGGAFPEGQYTVTVPAAAVVGAAGQGMSAPVEYRFSVSAAAAASPAAPAATGGSPAAGGAAAETPGTATNTLPAAAESRFPDLRGKWIEGHWAAGIVEELAKEKLIQGFADGSFRPEQAVTRYETCVLLYRVLGSGTASGAQAGSQVGLADQAQIPEWAREAVAGLTSRGIVTGQKTAAGLEFQGDRPLQRYELAVFLARMLEKPLLGSYPEVTEFRDGSAFPLWSRSRVGQALQYQLISGYPDRTYRPLAGVTRAELAAAVYNLRKAKTNKPPTAS